MKKPAKFRIVKIERPHRHVQFQVQRRFFGSWGWWVNYGHVTKNGYWFNGLFEGLQAAEEYIKEELATPKKKEIINYNG